MAAVSLRRRASVALVPLCFLSSCNLIEQSIQDRVAGTFNVSIGWPGGRAPPGLPSPLYARIGIYNTDPEAAADAGPVSTTGTCPVPIANQPVGQPVVGAGPIALILGQPLNMPVPTLADGSGYVVKAEVVDSTSASANVLYYGVSNTFSLTNGSATSTATVLLCPVPTPLPDTTYGQLSLFSVSPSLTNNPNVTLTIVTNAEKGLSADISNAAGFVPGLTQTRALTNVVTDAGMSLPSNLIAFSVPWNLDSDGGTPSNCAVPSGCVQTVYAQIVDGYSEASKVETATVALDQIAPGVASASVEYAPPLNSVVSTVTAATVGSTVTVSVSANETIDTSKPISLRAIGVDQGTPVEMDFPPPQGAPGDGGPGGVVFVFELPEVPAYLAGHAVTLLPQVTWTDLAGNTNVNVAFNIEGPGGVNGISLQSVAVSAPTTATPNSVVYTRVPWGNAEVGEGIPTFFVRGTSQSAPNDTTIIVYNGPDRLAVGVQELGRASVNNDQSFTVPMPGAANPDAVFCMAADAVGNVSSLVPVFDVTWIATFGGKGPGEALANPNTLFVATDLLVLPDAGNLYVDENGPTADGGPPVQNAAHTRELADYQLVESLDAGMAATSDGGWVVVTATTLDWQASTEPTPQYSPVYLQPCGAYPTIFNPSNLLAYDPVAAATSIISPGAQLYQWYVGRNAIEVLLGIGPYLHWLGPGVTNAEVGTPGVLGLTYYPGQGSVIVGFTGQISTLSGGALADEDYNFARCINRGVSEGVGADGTPRLVAFGGTSSVVEENGSCNLGEQCSDTVTFDVDGGWTTQPEQDGGPQVRQLDSPVLAYDSDRKVTVLFGAQDDNGPNVWEWDGSQWLLRGTNVGHATIGSSVAAYDATRGVTVLVNGGDTFEWNGSAGSWVEDNFDSDVPQGAAATGTLPPLLFAPNPPLGMAYDTGRSTMVLAYQAVTWQNPSQPERRAAAIAEFDFGAAVASAPIINEIDFRAIAGGMGNTLVPPGSGTPVAQGIPTPGATMAAWDSSASAWRTLQTTPSGVESPGDLRYGTGSAAEAQHYVFGANRAITVALFSTTGRGNGLARTQVAFGYMELTVHYHQSPRAGICAGDTDCVAAAEGPYCDMSLGLCVPCVDTNQCIVGQTCVNDVCVSGSSQLDCAQLMTCQTACLDTCDAGCTTCAQACASDASPAAYSLYQSLSQCLATACPATGTGACVTAGAACTACTSAAGQTGGACASAAATCQEN